MGIQELVFRNKVCALEDSPQALLKRAGVGGGVRGRFSLFIVSNRGEC